MGSSGKRVLLTSNGDDISNNIAFQLAKQGCRYNLHHLIYLLWFHHMETQGRVADWIYMFRVVLMGDERSLRDVSHQTMDLEAVEVIGLDMEEERESTFCEAVDKACNILGYIDAFVNCYTYQGTHLLLSLLGYHMSINNFCYLHGLTENIKKLNKSLHHNTSDMYLLDYVLAYQ